MKDMERLAIASAIQKRVNEYMSAKDPDSLRGRADAEVLRMYDRTGARSYDLKVAGEKVGTYSVRLSKPKSRKVAVVDDPDAVAAYAMDNPDDLVRYLRERAGDVAQWLLEDSGTVADGAEVTEQGGGPERLGTTLRVDPAKVGDALHGQLPQAIAGLLDGGGE